MSIVKKFFSEKIFRSARNGLIPAALLFLAVFPAVPAAAQSAYSGASAYYEAGQVSMAAEDWYAAAEAFLECLRINPAHAEASASLAEAYYELGEYDQALSWIRKARSLARGNMALANLEAFILIALGRLEAASSVISEVLSREPYNKEALFAAAELDIARGRAGEAVQRYQEVVRRYPDDRRVLISLALVLGSLGDRDNARTYINRAMNQHPDDYRVYYYAAYLDAGAGQFASAIRYAERSLHFKPGFAPARSLLASLRYRSGQYQEAARLADESIAANREDVSAWYLKAMSYIRMGRPSDALSVLSIATSIDPDDEFVRAALEEVLITTTSLEDPQRIRWASWHFSRARDFKSRNLMDQALFEYRRGLRLNPYAADRREYADLLRVQGYPSRYVEELRFMQDIGLADRTVNDAVEAYDSLLSDAIFRQWNVDPVELANRHWKVAVFSAASQSAIHHADAGAVASGYIRDILIHDRNIRPMDLELRQSSYSSAFRNAREAGADYFLIVSVSENERDLSLTGELFVGRTGSPAAVFRTYRTGADRLRNASRSLVDQLVSSLPFKAELIRRRGNQGLIDKGKADGVDSSGVYEIIKKGRSELRNEGIGITYAQEDLVGTLVIENVGDEIASGSLSRSGFFDLISPGDTVYLKVQDESGSGVSTGENPVDPELRALLRSIR
ncbi:tetratricopeptide repeat protein [Breznakiella homolactica]|uniref:Tetratricopeptide repeat protein n=1 Tax=Breznakiella homolactica TaxID=2798577 RepID=A0A7T7XKX5_9SPIR|nr:tetratricopeptide repeat protein [Breznakiella homolactica]QQO08289.1 tetratricopeptide repeat protein [Breznakiella homolactica]